MQTMTREQVREIDRLAVEKYAMPSIILMENAGRGAAEVLEQQGIAGPVVICAGKGNNGGDGFVVARHLHNRGHDVRVLLFCNPQDLKGDAETNYGIVAAAGIPLEAIDSDSKLASLSESFKDCDWIVDALLGTGTEGELRAPYPTIIEAINKANQNVFALDVPSGMDCDTGEELGTCVEANHTATFVARKPGFDAAGAVDKTGTVHVIDIGVPRAALKS